MGKGGETLVFWESCLDMASLGATGGLGADSIEMQDGNIWFAEGSQRSWGAARISAKKTSLAEKGGLCPENREPSPNC